MVKTSLNIEIFTLSLLAKNHHNKKNLISERMPQTTNKPENIREKEQKIDRTKMLYKRNKTAYDFTKFKTIGNFGDPIRNAIIMMDMANDEQE